MNQNPPYDRWQDTRALLRLLAGVHVAPWFRDVFARILPGFVLLLGLVAVAVGATFVWDLIEAFFGWRVLLFSSIVAWIVGVALLCTGRFIRYARPLEPPNWCRALWLEAIQDVDDAAELAVRRKLGLLHTSSLSVIGIGTACVVLLVISLLLAGTYWSWAVLLALVGLVAVRTFREVLGRPWTLALSAALGLVLLIGLPRLPDWTPLALLVAVIALRVVHVLTLNAFQRIILSVFPAQEAVPVRPRHVPGSLGPQGSTDEDEQYAGSRYADVRSTIYERPYYHTWGDGQTPLPVYQVTLESVLRGILPFGQPWQFRAAARRAVDTMSDVRGTAPPGRGYRRLLHPNGVCLFGEWEITEPGPWTGYFAEGSKALIIGRYSTCCTETRRGRTRSLSLVGKLYPTTDKDHKDPLPTASFITQEDLGGDTHEYINTADLRSAPDTSAWRRGLGPNGLPVISITGLLFGLVDQEPAIRQLYEIAELGKPEDEPTRAPEFMRLLVAEDQPQQGGADMDFRDEVLAHIYDPGFAEPRRELVFNIEVAEGMMSRGPAFFQRRTFNEWRRIGRIVFREGVASYNGDHIVHFSHPGWRLDHDRPSSTIRLRGRRVL